MKKLTITFLVTLLLSACGGESSNSGSNEVAPPPVSKLPEVIEGQLIALNKVTGAATVGRYNVDLGELKQRSTIESIDDLEVGMVLTLRTDGNQTVQSVVYDDLLVAPVSGFDDETNTLTMAGKTVLTQEAKLTAGLVLDANVIDDVLEISGFAVDQNTIRATYIGLKHQNALPEGDVFGEIKGLVTNLKTNEKNFNLGTMLVNYANAYVSFPLQNGALVEVSGFFNDSTIAATEIELEQYNYNDNSTIEVEGVVTQVSVDKSTGRATKVLLNGSRIIELPVNGVLYEDFPYENGLPTIRLGMLIDVEGKWLNNSIHAVKIECDYGCQLSPVVPPINDLIGEFNVEGLAIYEPINNTISLNGFSFVVSQYADWEGIIPTNWTTPTWVSLSGMMDGQSNLVWEIENEFAPEQDIDLEGVVTVENDTYALWGYRATDNSLAIITELLGMRIEVECRFNQSNNTISLCQLDD